MSHAVLAALGENIRVCDSADFDATNDYLLRGADLTGVANSQTGIFSCWVRIDGGNSAQISLLHNALARFLIIRNSSNKFRLVGKNAAGSGIIDIATSSTYLASTTWLNVLIAWDLANTTASIYISDISDFASSGILNDTLDYTDTDWAIGAIINGNAKFDGCMSELYFAPGQYLDFSVIANRRKFISSGGRPVYLGSDGSLPTGTAPLVYSHLDDGEAVANFATNRGTGGDFTITGTLATGSTSPSD